VENKNQQLYFIALIPPENISQKIHQIKLYVSTKYHCKHSLKSPPHITIIPPFRYSDKKENKLLEPIQFFNQKNFPKSISVQINNYDVFLPKVIFIKVLHSDELQTLYEKTNHFVKTELNIVKDLEPRPFHPHITIAFRDIKKTETLTIKNDVEQHFPISEKFEISKISLLKYIHHQWEIIL
jgi:2'-5' RNA ligase